jgi:HEAT repeat protein
MRLFHAMFALAVLAASPVSAQRVREADVRRALDSSEPAEVGQAIEAIGANELRRLIPALDARIRRGLTPELLTASIETLATLARPEAGPILFELASHRRVEVRRQAVRAIRVCKPRGAEEALVRALSDMDGDVRREAAQALGEIGTAEAVDPLFRAFDRGIAEAGASLGAVVRPEDVGRLLEYLGRAPLASLETAIFEILGRENMPEAKKLEVIERIEGLATAGARTLLESYLATLADEPANANLRRVTQAAIGRINAQ